MAIMSGVAALAPVIAGGAKLAGAIGRTGAAGARARREAEPFQFKKQAYLDLLERGRKTAETGERRFLRETEAPLPQLARVREDIMRRALPTQRRQEAQSKLALREAGVRGPQRGLALQRAGGEFQLGLQEMLNRMALGEAERRRAQRARFFAGQAGMGRQAQLRGFAG